jgi:hypothetical protein
MYPIQCHLWTKNVLTEDDFDFEKVETLYESSHFDHIIYRCKKCGQLYFYDFYEWVDFENGNDKIYITYVPISAIEEGIKMNDNPNLQMKDFSPRLLWEPDGSIFWVGKVSLVKEV